MPSPIVHFQLGAGDAEALATFLREVFEWDVDTPSGRTAAIDTGAAEVQPNDIFVSGTVRQLAPGASPFTSVYVRVADLDGTVQRAMERGARLVVPRTDREGQPTVAVIEAPSGHAFGIVQL